MERTRVVVDYDSCEANALCMGVAPEVFEVDDNDDLHVHQEYPPPALMDKVRQAVGSCPKRAISLAAADG